MTKQTKVFHSKSLLDVHRLVTKERRLRVVALEEEELLVQSKEEIIVIGQSVVVVARRMSSGVHLLIRVQIFSSLLKSFSSCWCEFHFPLLSLSLSDSMFHFVLLTKEEYVVRVFVDDAHTRSFLWLSPC
jgi:hypothetical protein